MIKTTHTESKTIGTKRKTQLYDGLLGYLVDLIPDEDDLVDILHRIGFTDREIEIEDLFSSKGDE